MVAEEYGQYAGVNEYAASGWIRFGSKLAQENWHTIFRLTINPPEI